MISEATRSLPRLRPLNVVLYEGVPLRELPQDATLQIWRKPEAGFNPVEAGTHHSSIISSDGDTLIVCFAQMGVNDWEDMKRVLAVGENLGVRTLLIGTGTRSEIGSALCGTGHFTALHGGVAGLYTSALFKPSPRLMQVWDIARVGRPDEIRNALLLLRRGRILSRWVSEPDDAQPHDWTRIHPVID